MKTTFIDNEGMIDYILLERCYPELYAEWIETDMDRKELLERLEDIEVNMEDR